MSLLACRPTLGQGETKKDMSTLPEVHDGQLIIDGKPYSRRSILDKKHHLQISLRDIDRDLAGINPKLSTAVTLRAKRKEIEAQIEKLEQARLSD